MRVVQWVKNFKVCAVAGLLLGLAAPAHADGQFWVVGIRANQSCDIVTSNPLITPLDGYYFGSGPYRSLDDAKLARSTISACPKVDESASSPK